MIKPVDGREGGLNDIPPVIQKAFEMGGGFFNELWRVTLREDERSFLVRLIRKEVLERVNGELRFQVPLIGQYISEKKVFFT